MLIDMTDQPFLETSSEVVAVYTSSSEYAFNR